MHAVDNMHTMDAKDNLPWPGGLSLSAQLAILGLGLVRIYATLVSLLRSPCFANARK
jgi:hypothetical protein